MMRPHFRPDLAAPDLMELLALDEAAFERRFAGTPIRRAKRRGLLRNVCVALGNIGNEAALPALERAATDAEPLVAEHARWAIARIRGRRINTVAQASAPASCGGVSPPGSSPGETPAEPATGTAAPQ
jgi:hypothetical protein